MATSTFVGKQISAARKGINLSQAQLAERISISPQAIGKWERGESLPDITMLDKLAKLFGVELNYFSESSGGQASRPSVTSLEPAATHHDPMPEKAPNLKSDMSRANWADADFSGLKHLKEKFNSANLKNCKFIASDLSGLSLSKNDVEGCDFSRADLQNARLEAAQVNKNSFRGCSLIDAVFEKSEIRNCDFSEANLSGAEFLLAHFEGNTIENTLLTHTAFKGTAIADIVITGTLENCSFENCAFKNVKFENATIKSSFFKHNKKLNRVQFVNCVVDKITYAFLKTGDANLSGITILDQNS